MKNFYLTTHYLQIAALALFLIPLCLDAQSLKGLGTDANPFQISGIEDLKKISDSNYYRDKHIILANDIDASVTRNWNILGSDTLGFLPIGNDAEPFTGSFNGNGYSISNVYINRPSQNNVALFGNISYASVANLSLKNAVITGSDNVGGIVGTCNFSSLTDCFVTGIISGNQSVGGVTGTLSYSAQSNCAVDAEVSGTVIVGGGIGTCDNSEVVNSLMTGKVSGGMLTGGIISLNKNSIVSNCYAAGEVNGNNYLGGLIGQNSASEVNGCFFDTIATNQNSAFSFDDNMQIVKGLSTTDFADSTIFMNARWDFNDVWEINSIATIDTVKRPYLKMLIYDYQINVDVMIAPQNSVKGASWYNTGDTVRLYANNSSYYKFKGWKLEGDTVVTDPLYEFICSGSFSCTAVFDYNFNGGTGSAEDPYQIANYEQLSRLSHLSAVWNKHFILTDNINAISSGSQNIEGTDTLGFLPIGNSDTAFTGAFNGKGYVIEHLFINRPLDNYVGLFGKIEGASVSNTGLLNPDITGRQYVGGLAGYAGNKSLMEESYVSGAVVGGTYTGGLSGANSNSVVKNCFSSARVTGNSNTGGLAGLNSTSAVINNCYSAGKVTAGSVVGGLTGENLTSSIILNCYFDTLTSGLATGIGNDDNSQTVKALSTIDFGTDSLFTNSGWDFTYVWETRSDSVHGQNSRPYLKVFRYDYKVSIDVSTAPKERVSGGGWYNSGDTVVLKAQPSPYYIFNFWQSDDTVISSNDTYKFICTSKSNITAIFEYDFTGGDGTKENPYQVSTLEHLRTISDIKDLWDDHFILINDIDASDTRNWNVSGSDTLGFSPIGYKFQLDDMITMFSGSFNGDGHKISGLYINRMNKANVALFGAVGYAKISNLGLIAADISGHSCVAGLVGYQEYSDIENCMVTGRVSGKDWAAGGIVGISGYYCTIYNCYSLAEVSCSSYVGGIVGEISGGTYGESVKMAYCYAGGSVQGDTIVGSLIGRNLREAGIKNCYFDSLTCNQSIGTGTGTDFVNPLGTAEFVDTSSFSGWDWHNSWQMAYSYDNVKRPCLMWEPVFSAAFKIDGKGGMLIGDLQQTIISDCSSDTVVAVCNRGYRFVGWKNEKDDIISTDSIFVIPSVKSDSIVKAIFKRMAHKVIFSVSDGNTAIVNADIRYDTMSYKTDSSGSTELQLPNGNYSFKISAHGYKDTTIFVTVFDDDVSLNIVLHKLPAPVYTVTFYITDSIKVIENALVEFNGNKYTTDSAGLVKIKNVENGRYTYTVTANGHVGKTNSITVAGKDTIVTVILKNVTMVENRVTEKIRLFPNPVSESLKIELPYVSGETTIHIYNIFGEVVYSESNYGRKHCVVNLSNFKNGLYIVQVNSEFGKVYLGKVVKN